MLFCMAKNLAFPEILTIAFNSGMYLGHKGNSTIESAEKFV